MHPRRDGAWAQRSAVPAAGCLACGGRHVAHTCSRGKKAKAGGHVQPAGDAKAGGGARAGGSAKKASGGDAVMVSVDVDYR